MKTEKFEVISEESATRGKVLFVGTLKECYQYQKTYKGEKYPSLSIVK